jgi:WD40 repeat protein
MTCALRRHVPVFWIFLLAAGTASLPGSDAAPPAAPPSDGKGADALPEGVLRAIPGRVGDEWARLVAISPDLTVLATEHHDGIRGGDYQIRFWDVKTGKPLPAIVKQFGSQYALSPGGRLLAMWMSRDGGLQVWDAAAGKLLHTLCRFTNEERDTRLDRHALAFSPDGKVLVHGDRATITFWDVGTGKELKDRRITLPEKEAVLTCLTLSSDGRRLAAGNLLPLRSGRYEFEGRVRLFDAATGRLLSTLQGRSDVGIYQTWLTVDGRVLAALVTDRSDPGRREEPFGTANRLRLWELASGKEVLDLRLPWVFSQCRDLASSEGFYSVAALSRNGRLFAADLHGITLWDTASGKQVHQWKRPGAKYHAAFVEGDNVLLVQDADGLHSYDVASRMKALPAPAAPDREALARLWADLAAADAARARRALWALVDAPKQSVPMLAANLKPVPAPTTKELSRLIADLDADKHPIRAAARSELEQLRELAEPALRQALSGGLSAEQRRAVSELLERLDQPIAEGEKLRRLRAIEALEHMGARDATALLAEIGRGAPAALETQSAQQSLNRLARRPATSP